MEALVNRNITQTCLFCTAYCGLQGKAKRRRLIVNVRFLIFHLWYIVIQISDPFQNVRSDAEIQ